MKTLHIIRIWPFSAFDNEELKAIRITQKPFSFFLFFKTILFHLL